MNNNEGITAPVIAGLAVGVTFIVTLAMMNFNALSQLSQGNGSDNDTTAIDCEKFTDLASEPQRCLDARVPDMTMTIASRKYYGDKGSFCSPSVCVDKIFIVPEKLIRIEKGTEVAFEVVGFRQPDMLGVTIYKGENRPAEDLQLGQTNDKSKFIVDLPNGDYIFFVSANWMKGQYSEMSATYFYKVKVS